MIDHLATASTRIAADGDRVWAALTQPHLVERWMLGARVESDWSVGSRITWSGEFEGRQFEDRGTILAATPASLLRFTHFSSLSGKQDIPENYHTVTWSLEQRGDGTEVRLSQDNNQSEDAAAHSAANWQSMLDALRVVAEGAE
jgi:uncharacterized protein YndB with AHSA1/START domain